MSLSQDCRPGRPGPSPARVRRGGADAALRRGMRRLRR